MPKTTVKNGITNHKVRVEIRGHVTGFLRAKESVADCAARIALEAEMRANASGDIRVIIEAPKLHESRVINKTF